MLVKYTDHMEEIQIKILQKNYISHFKRNVWKEVPDEIGKMLLKDPCFMSTEDVVFDKETFNNSNMKIGLKRFGAFGDLLMLLPVVRYLKRTTQNKYFLITNPQYVKIMKKTQVFDGVIENSQLRKEKFNKVYYLDGVLEKDHSLTNHQRMMHRIKIYEEFFQITLDKYDFEFTISDKDKEHVESVLNALL
jgi:hypothetical protein